MKKPFLFLVVTILLNAWSYGQPINFRIYNPTGAVLKILYGPNKTDETTYYLKNNKLAASLNESDMYAIASEVNDTIRLNAFYTVSDQLALSYTMLRKGKEIQFMDYIGYDLTGSMLGYAHNLLSSKGIMMVKDHEAMSVEIYRNGNKVEEYGLTKVAQDRLIVFTVGNGSKVHGVLNMEGDIIIPVAYEQIVLDKDLFILTNSKQRRGAYDLSGKQIVPVEFDEIIPMDYLVAVGIDIKSNEKENYGLYDRKGNLISPPVNPFIDFTNGPVPVLNEDKFYGYIDEAGNPITPFIYKEAKKFSEGLAVVANQKGEFGFIDITGKLVVPFKYYTVVNGFENGKAKVTESRFKKAYEIDKNGNKVIP